MARSNKPIIWGLFAAGGTVAAFVAPVLILMTCIAIPLGLLSPDVLSYAHLHDLLQHPLSRLAIFGMLFLMLWHAAHRMRITAHDVGIRNDTLVWIIFYGIAAVGTVVAVVALLNL